MSIIVKSGIPGKLPKAAQLEYGQLALNYADEILYFKNSLNEIVPVDIGNSGGTVTNVSGTGTVNGITLSGSVSTSGNLSLGGTLTVLPSNFETQIQKTFLAAPSATDGTPTFRTISASDIPTLNQSTTGNAGTVTNGVYTTGSYADPAWITSINYSKLTGTVPTWNQNTTGSAATLTTARTLTIGNTGKTFNGSTNVSWTTDEIGAESLHTFGVPRSNLGTPTVREMALFDAQFDNKTERYDIANIFVETSTDNVNWTTFSITDDNKRKLVGGDSTYSGLSIPNGTAYFRIRLRATSYVFLNALYMYWSSNGHSTQVQVFKKHDSGSWTQHTNSTTAVGAWPGHLYLPFSTIPWNSGATLGVHWHEVYVVFIPTWNGTYPANGITLSKMQWWGGYPAGRRNLYGTNEFGDASFPAAISAVGTITAPTFSGNLTGNATTATTLQTARTINGVSFDGSANITIADSTKQPLDADLTAIAALAGTSGLLRKTAADTWSLDTNTYVTSSGVTSVTGTTPIVSSGGTTPAISITAATTSAAGSMSAADKLKLDGIATGATANTGTVTSVSMSVPSFLSISGSPITASGTLAVTYSGTALPIANGGTGATTAATARTSLGATIVGNNLFTVADPSAIRFIRVNADNTVSLLSDADFRTAISVGTGGGGSTAPTTAEITATAGQTVFSTPYAPSDVAIYLNGVLLNSTDYTATDGTTITLAVGAKVGSVLKVRSYAGVSSANTKENVVYVSGNMSATQFRAYVFRASAILTLPATPAEGDWIKVTNRSGLLSCVIARNGLKIMGLNEDLTIDSIDANLTLMYTDTTDGWVFV